MLKAIPIVLTAFSIGVGGLSCQLLSAKQSVETKVFSCLRLDGQAQLSCFKEASGQAQQLGKLAKGLAG
ncbi:hypothetical protein [Stutzerimonas azotifigens]|uniref:hypothetical protein n=1 Tax=Stutzerimonas azotifigens TaxID=291995 RepID=UPI0004811573|nr:hypothetical protein [Stutzerimonas azotifigens]